MEETKLLDAVIAGLPKAELHCHIEGTLEPEMLFEMASRNGVTLVCKSVDELRDAYQFTRLQDFLDLYYQGMDVLRGERDFYDLTHACLQKAAAQNVRHLELFFDPQAHVQRGVPFAAVVDGISAALRDAEREWDLSSLLIMCFLRHLDERDAFDTLEMAKPHHRRGQIAGVGLDSGELGNPPEKFERVFALARSQGYRCVAHAGEEGPPDYVRGALDALKVERIDHGNAALADAQLVERLVAQAVPLTLCPLSNLKLRVIDNLSDHPLKKMLDLGLHVTINSDDPAYFGGYLNENYHAVAEALNLTPATLTQLARNSITASFAEPQRREALLAEVDDWCCKSEPHT